MAECDSGKGDETATLAAHALYVETHQPSVHFQTSPVIPFNPHTLQRIVITDMKPPVQSRVCN